MPHDCDFMPPAPNQFELLRSRAHEACIELGLPEQLPVAAVVANPTATLLYHGVAHLFSVALTAFHHSAELPMRERRELFVAGLFHDFDHADEADHLNVARAISGFRSFAEDRVDLLGGVNPAPVTDLIRAISERSVAPVRLAEAIIADADAIQCTGPHGAEYAQLLALEQGVESGATAALEIELRALHTEWARDHATGTLARRRPRITKV